MTRPFARKKGGKEPGSGTRILAVSDKRREPRRRTVKAAAVAIQYSCQNSRAGFVK